MDAVAVDSVWKYFGDYPALRAVTLNVPEGACLALLGRNGAGKTTLLRILANLSRPSEGTLSFFGASGKGGEVRAKIGYLGHGIGVYDDLSALENLILFGRLHGIPHPETAALRALERVGLARVKDGLAREKYYTARNPLGPEWGGRKPLIC